MLRDLVGFTLYFCGVIMSQVSIDIRARVIPQLRAKIDAALKSTADYIVTANIDSIHAQLTPNGAPQKQNHPGYAKKKISLFGHSIPLIAKESSFITAGNYRIEAFKEGDSFGYAIYPPDRRLDIIDELRDAGYELFEIPESAVEYIKANLAAQGII